MTKKEELSVLVSKHQFDDVLSKVQEYNDESLVFFEVLSYLGKGDYNKVLETITNKEKLLIKYEPVKTIRLHIKTLAFLDEFVKAYRALDHYKDLPYINQEVEETFKELDEFLEAEEEAKKKAEEDITIEDMNKILSTSEDIVEIYKAFSYSEKLPFDGYKEALKMMLVRENIPQDLRSVALAIAIDNKLEEEISFLSINGLIKVKPNTLIPPHQAKEFKETITHIDELSNKDVTIRKNALNIFNLYNLISFPVEENKDPFNVAKASVYLAKKYMGINEKDTSNDIVTLASKIEKTIE